MKALVEANKKNRFKSSINNNKQIQIIDSKTDD